MAILMDPISRRGYLTTNCLWFARRRFIISASSSRHSSSTATQAYRRSSHIPLRQHESLKIRRHSTSNRMATEQLYDVVIVGGGPNGLALANALRSNAVTSTLKIALVETQDLKRSAAVSETLTTFSNRCSSLTPGSLSFLEEIGALKFLDQRRVQPFSRMSVWDGISGQSINFDWASVDKRASSSSSAQTSADSTAHSQTADDGYTVATMAENSNTVSALLSRAEELGGIDFFDNTSVTSIDLGSESSNGLDLRQWPVVSLSNGKKLTARLLVGADGGNSPVRRFADIASRGWDYERMGVVATLQLAAHGQPETNQDYTKTAYQRFLPSGPVAMLPLPGNMATLVWSTTPERAAHLKSLNRNDFTAMVNAAFRLRYVDIEFMHSLPQGQAEELMWRLQHTTYDGSVVPREVQDVQNGSVAAFPLKLRHVDTYVGERVALVGDAAHSIHPLAGQGLNSGLADVRALSTTISNALQSGSDIGVGLSLESYNASRYASNHALMGAIDKLHKLYAMQSGPVVAARSIGLGIVEHWGPLKGFFMRQASSA